MVKWGLYTPSHWVFYVEFGITVMCGISGLDRGTRSTKYHCSYYTGNTHQSIPSITVSQGNAYTVVRATLQVNGI